MAEVPWLKMMIVQAVSTAGTKKFLRIKPSMLMKTNFASVLYVA